MLRRIVAGIDGGEAGHDAAVLARALAEGDACDLLLVGVWPDMPLPISVLLTPDVRPLDEIEHMLRDVRTTYAPQAITRPLSDRSPARALRRTAQREHATLIVLGPSHKARPGRARAGPDARQVVQEAPCAVAVAASGLQRAPFALRRIVVGVDEGPEAAAALERANRLAAATGAHVTAVAVIDDALRAGFGPLSAGLDAVNADDVVAERRAHAQRLADRVMAAGDAAAAEVRVGVPADELARAAEEADLLVVGSRHWGPLARVVVGSVAERLMRDAPCSLMLVPRPGREDAPGVGER